MSSCQIECHVYKMCVAVQVSKFNEHNIIKIRVFLFSTFDSVSLSFAAFKIRFAF